MPYLSQKVTSWINFSIILALALFCIVNGALILTRQQPAVIFSVLYSQECGTNQTCKLEFDVKDSTTEPVAIYYILQNFVHNAKDYERARVLKQLKGTSITVDEAIKCNPHITNFQMNANTSWNGTVLNGNDVASPCGLQAKNLFTDAFSLVGPAGNLTLRRSGFVKRFEREPQSASIQWIDPLNEPFQIWMHNSIGKDLRKLYGTIDSGLPAGHYTLSISNTYSYQTNEQKQVELSIYRPNVENCFSLGILLVVSGGAILLTFGLQAYLKRSGRVVPTAN